MSKGVIRHMRRTGEKWRLPHAALSTYMRGADITSILVLKIDHIGDFFLALDSFFCLREAFPKASLTLVCGPWNVALAKSTDIFDKIIPIGFFASRADAPSPGLNEELISQLPKDRFDLAVDLRVDPDTRVLLDHVTATSKCGYASDFTKLPLTFSVPRPNIDEADNLGIHQRMMMLRLAHSVVDFCKPKREARAAYREKLVGNSQIKLSRPQGSLCVALHAFSGRAIKNWPLENFIDLTRWLCHDMGIYVALLGTTADAPDPHVIERSVQSEKLISFIGKTTLLETIDLIAQSDLYIGNDTGITHIAASLDVPTIAIYAGIDPTAVFAPYGRNVTILRSWTECSPCHLAQMIDCKHDHQCLRSIQLSVVKSEARLQILRSSSGW